MSNGLREVSPKSCLRAAPPSTGTGRYSKSGVRKRRVRRTSSTEITPAMPVRAPHSSLTAEREKLPPVEKAWKHEPMRLARPIPAGESRDSQQRTGRTYVMQINTVNEPAESQKHHKAPSSKVAKRRGIQKSSVKASLSTALTPLTHEVGRRTEQSLGKPVTLGVQYSPTNS